MRQLNESELESFRQELDALRARVTASIGQEDADHVRSIRTLARTFEISGRLLIHFSLEPVSFGLGVLGLGLYKILENMEIGHNVLHGQYDFMGDPSLDSKTYEWDMVGTAKTWKRAHNVSHHTFTNVIGKDDDFGYTAFRFSSDVAWNPIHLLQPIVSPMSGLFFDHSIALYDLRLTHYLLPKMFRNAELAASRPPAELREDLSSFALKAAKSYAKEYVFYPALAGPFALKVAAGNALASALRNVWAYAVIYCGHLTLEGTAFPASTLVNESRGGFYRRQILGSSNFEAGPVLGVLSGHLSHQIEHHLFPDIPAWRYRAMSAEVQRICSKYGVHYNTGTFAGQLKSVAKAMLKYALPEPKRRHPSVTAAERIEAPGAPSPNASKLGRSKQNRAPAQGRLVPQA